MSDRRDRSARGWATATSLIPIFGKNISQGILQKNLSKQQREAADKINPVDVEYNESPYAKERLDNARNAVNARMPGGTQLENNVYRNQSNTLMSLARVGTPQQQLAAAGALQGNTNNALSDLAMQEQQYRTGMLTNLNSALSGMVDEGDKVYNDKTNRFNRLFNQKQDLLNSSQNNFSNSLTSASDAVSSGVNTALNIFGIPGMGGTGRNLPSTGRASTIGGFNPANVGSPRSMSPFQIPRLTTNNPQITPYRP